MPFTSSKSEYLKIHNFLERLSVDEVTTAVTIRKKLRAD